MNTTGRSLLIVGGVANVLIALLHLAIPVLGPWAYLYFGTASLARMAGAGSPVPAIATFALALVFAACGLWALSGAGVIRRLPLLKLGLLGIGAVYTLRGLIVVGDLIRLARGLDYPFRQTVFSAVALAVGLLYLVGTTLEWKRLGRRRGNI